jgi:hypothetical protein
VGGEGVMVEDERGDGGEFKELIDEFKGRIGSINWHC